MNSSVTAVYNSIDGLTIVSYKPLANHKEFRGSVCVGVCMGGGGGGKGIGDMEKMELHLVFGK